MYSIRLLSLAAILFGSLVANAAVAPHHVHPGSVFVAKPVHFDPPHVRLVKLYCLQFIISDAVSYLIHSLGTQVAVDTEITQSLLFPTQMSMVMCR